jgi:hypothetical protein
MEKLQKVLGKVGMKNGGFRGHNRSEQGLSITRVSGSLSRDCRDSNQRQFFMTTIPALAAAKSVPALS